jgi:hypothetical protein
LVDLIKERTPDQKDVVVLEQIVYILGLLKMLRIFRLNWLLSRMLQVSTRVQKYVSLIKLFFLLLIVSHVLGCLYWGLFVNIEGDPVSPDGWVVKAGLDTAESVLDQYIPTIYFSLATLTSVGYGDISGNTITEQAFLMGVMLIGAIIYALILALMTSVMQSVFEADQPLNEKIGILERFFHLNPVDSKLRRTVSKALAYQWDLQKSFRVRDTLKILPDALRHKVMLELHKSLILKIPFFAQCEDIFIDALANLLWLEVCLRDSDIVRAGDLNQGLYFVNHGEVEVLGVAMRREGNSLFPGHKDVLEKRFKKKFARGNSSYEPTIHDVVRCIQQ